MQSAQCFILDFTLRSHTQRLANSATSTASLPTTNNHDQQVHSPTKPVLVFVASRRQTRLTALDLISHAAADERPTQFLNIASDELTVSDVEQVCREGGCWLVNFKLFWRCVVLPTDSERG